MKTQEILEQAAQEAMRTVSSEMGGPFGAAIVDETGKIFLASNTVLGSCDPTAHAEVNAIRKACTDKQSHDLSGCTLYTTCYPLSDVPRRLHLGEHQEVHYGCTPQDAKKIGFRDDYIYDFIQGNCKDSGVLTLHAEDKGACLELFEHYKREGKQLY